jgi:preprotein translocase subunit SecD
VVLSRVRRDAGILVLVAVLLGIAYWVGFPLSKTHLGLDLQGGLSVILEAKAVSQQSAVSTGSTATTQGDAEATSTTEAGAITDEKMDQTVKVIQDRVNRLGVAEPEIQRQGSDMISVQLPGIDNPDEALVVIGKTAVLGFYNTTQFGTGFATEEEALASAGVTSADDLPADKSLANWPEANGNTSGTEWYIVTGAPLLTGDALKDAGIGYGTNNALQVEMTFTSEGAEAFAQITGDMAETGQIMGETQRLAIVLDGVVESAATVKDKIEGGNAEITGTFDYEEANSLAVVLQTGSLPLELTSVSQSKIGATLGKAALEQALLAGAIGLLLIIVFMIGYYRLLGVVASLALIIYGVLFIGILNGIGVTMTLPGIAGMILTLGMAVDANVLIFSRMRDEIAAGKSVAAATNAGFRKAFRAVFDCNMTTILTAVILFWAASGSIKGFALTLGVGVALSMFTAVVVTRSMLTLLSGWSVFRHPKALGLHVPRSKTASAGKGGGV